MSRLPTVDIESATGKTKALLDRIWEDTGMVSSLLRVMANSPAVLDSYLAVQERLGAGVLDHRLRYQIALAVSQANGSKYCVAAYSALGRAAGLSDEALIDARRASSPNRRTDAALKFSQALETRPGATPNRYLDQLYTVGFNNTEIAEIAANAVFVSLSNYFYHISNVPLDFPSVNLAELDG